MPNSYETIFTPQILHDVTYIYSLPASNALKKTPGKMYLREQHGRSIKVKNDKDEYSNLS